MQAASSEMNRHATTCGMSIMISMVWDEFWYEGYMYDGAPAPLEGSYDIVQHVSSSRMVIPQLELLDLKIRRNYYADSYL